MSKERRLNRKIFKDSKEKSYKKLSRQLQELYDAKYSKGYITLETPRRCGWKKYFILRDDISNRSDAHIFRCILDRINDTVYSRDINFLTKDWKTGKYVPIEHKLKILSLNEYNNLDDVSKKYFYKSTFKIKIWNTERNVIGYCFRYDWMFVEKIAKHYITKLPILDNEIESRIKELENYIRSHNLYSKLYPSCRDAEYMLRKSLLQDKMAEKEMRSDLLNL